MAKPILTDFMNNELNLPNNAYPLDVFVALSELQDDVVEAQAAAAAKMEELAALRTQTAELFAERLMAEGADDEAVSAAKAMWAENPSLAAQAALGADIIEAANPYGCNQYGEGWKQPHNGKQSWRPGNPANKKDEGSEKKEEHKNVKADTEKKVDEAKNKANEAKKESSVAKKIQELDWRLYKVEVEITRTLREKRIAVDTKDDDKLKEVMQRLRTLDLERAVLENKIEDLKGDMNDEVSSSRTLTELLDEDDAIEAANPYGCNQYGEGWKQPHNGKQSWRPGNPANKKDEVDLDRDPDVNENGVDLKTGTTSKSRVNGAKNRHQAAQKLLRQFRKEVEKHDSESQEAKVWKSALVEAEKLALNISKATSVIIENPNGKTMRRAGEESFDELQKLRNLFHRTSLETKNKTADEKDEEEAIKLVQQALRKAAEEDEGDAHEMTLSEMLDDEDNKRH